jgi:hypothetical protein
MNKHSVKLVLADRVKSAEILTRRKCLIKIVHPSGKRSVVPLARELAPDVIIMDVCSQRNFWDGVFPE